MDSHTPQITGLLEKAFHYRDTLALNTNAMRLVNSQGDGLAGLIIDRFDTHFVVYILDPLWHPYQDAIKDILSHRYDVAYLVFKDRTVSEQRNAADITLHPVIDRQGSKTIVDENGLRFHVDLNDHLNQGLFMDMRNNRKLVASQSKDKAVLNCFAYTCSFGAYCRYFGATRVVNIDISAKFLKKGEENYRLNRLPTGRSEFVRDHAVHYIERAVKRNNFFDIVILDPPSFSRYAGKVFSVKKDLPHMMEQALRILNTGGTLFVSTNLSTIARAQLEEWARLAARQAGRAITTIDRLSQDIDFRGSGLMKESFLAALLIQTRRNSVEIQ